MSSQRLLDIWENIALKYGDVDPEEDDEVDILTGEIVIDRGKLRDMERVEMGNACDDLFEDIDDDEEDSQVAPDSSQAEEFQVDEDHDVLDVWDNTDIEQRIETNIPDFLKPDLERLDPAVLPKPTPRWSRADDADLMEFLRSEEEKRAKRGEKPIAEEKEVVKEEKLKDVGRSGSQAPADSKSIKSWNVLPSRLRGTIHLPIDLMPEADDDDDDDDDPLSDITSGSPADFGIGKLHLTNSSATRSVHFASSRMSSPSPLLKSALIKSGSPVPSAFKTPRSHGPSPLSRSTLPFQHDSARTPSSPLNPSSVRPPQMQVASTSSKKATEIVVAPESIDVDLHTDLQDVLKKQTRVEEQGTNKRPSQIKYEDPESPTTADRPRRIRKRRVQYPEPETMNVVLTAELSGRMVVVPRGAEAVEQVFALASASWKDKGKWRASSQAVKSKSGPPGRLWSPSDSCPPTGFPATESTAPKTVETVARRDRRRSSIRSPDRTELPATPLWKTLPETPIQEDQTDIGQSSSNRKDFRSFYLTPTQQPAKSRTSSGNTPVSLKSADGVHRGRGRPYGSCSDCDKAGRLTVHVCPGRLSRKKCPFMQKGVNGDILLELMRIAMESKIPMSPAQRDLVNGLKPKTEPVDSPVYESARAKSRSRRRSATTHEDRKETKEEFPGGRMLDGVAGEVAEKHSNDGDLVLMDPPATDVLVDRTVVDMPTVLNEEGIFPTPELPPLKTTPWARSPSSALSSLPPLFVKDEEIPTAVREDADVDEDDDDVLLLGSSPVIKNEVDLYTAGSPSWSSKRKTTANLGITPPKRVKWNGKTGAPVGWNSPTTFMRGNEVIDVDEWKPVDEDEGDVLDDW
jgi:hypothetical protein